MVVVVVVLCIASRVQEGTRLTTQQGPLQCVGAHLLIALVVAKTIAITQCAEDWNRLG